MFQLNNFLEMITSIKEQVSKAKESGEKIIVVFGWTGSGKSTTINALMGSNLQFNNKNELVVEQGNEVYTKIGHGDQSHTLYPALIKDKNSGYSFFDTAGVMDQRAEGHETDSGVAACSLPILLQDSAVHAVIFVISKDFLGREGLSSFAELFKNLGNFINFNHELVCRKIFIAMTKTLDVPSIAGIASIEQMLPITPDALKGNLRQVINSFYTNSENEIRTKLGTRKTTLKLEHIIDERERFGNVFLFHGIKNDTKQLWHRLTGCNFVCADMEPQLDNVDEFMLTTRAAYVRYKNHLYYINQFEKTCSKIDIIDENLKNLDDKLWLNLLTETNALRSLSEEELRHITQLTGHSHLNEVMHPLSNDAFLLSEPVTYESAFGNLRARIDAIEISSDLPEFQQINQFKIALRDMVQSYHLLFSRAIHLPRLEDIKGRSFQIAILNVLAYYAQHDVIEYPNCLTLLINCFSEFPKLLTTHFEQTESLNQFLEKSLLHLNTLLQFELPQAVLSKDDQLNHISNGMNRVHSIEENHVKEFQQILENLNKDTDYLYWQQLLHSCAELSEEKKDKFQYDSNRTQESADILNQLIEFNGIADDDAMIAILASTLLAISKIYQEELHAPLPMTNFPLAYNIPMIYQVLQSMICIEQDVDRIDPDPNGHFFNQIKTIMDTFKNELIALSENSGDILTKLLDDYYHCVENIKLAQTNYITSYQNHFAKSIDLMAGPTPYVDTFNGGKISATLNVAGGGTLNPHLYAHIDKHLLAAEALGLSQFSLGHPTINDGVGSLVLDGKDFVSSIDPKDTNQDLYASGCLAGRNLFDNFDAEWERKVNIKIFNQDAYSTRVYKKYEHFQTKTAVHKIWYNQNASKDGTPPGPGHFLVNFGAYNVERREPFWVLSHTNGQGDVWYTSGPNHDYDAQTKKVQNKIRQAMLDYIDIQLSRIKGRTASWSYADKEVSLSGLASQVQLINPAVITHASTQINNWFITHRTNIANSFRDHTAHPGLPVSTQDELNKRKTLLINLDIQGALIQLFAKLIGKNPFDSLLARLVDAETVGYEVASIPDLQITDPSPSLTTALVPKNAITADQITDLKQDIKTRYLHPLTLLIQLENKCTLHSAWRELKFCLPPLMIAKPQNDIDTVEFLRNIPEQATQFEISCRDLSSATHQACLAIAIRNHTRFLEELTLHHVNIKSIAGILQTCGSLEILNITHNPLYIGAFTDLMKFIVRDTQLKSLDISADPLGEPIILENNIALSLLAALYLNHQLVSLKMHNIVFQSPIIARAIEHILLHKNRINELNLSNRDEYFAAIDEHLNNFIKAHAHPISELDKSTQLFRAGVKNAKPLRTIISKITASKTASTQPAVHTTPANVNTPTPPAPSTSNTSSKSQKHSEKSKSTGFFSRPISRFIVDYRPRAQNGWNCFDVAVDIKRDELVRYALARADNAEFRQFLAPEIRHAAAMTVLEMNDSADKKNNKNLRDGLPADMCNRHLQDLVNNYQLSKEDPRFLEAFRNCCNAIGRFEGNRPTLSQLLEYFKDEKHLEQHRAEYNTFIAVYNEIIDSAQQAFFAYSSHPNTYRQYLRTYYLNGGWVAFQADNSGSIVEIAARMLEATIVIHQPVAHKPGEWREIYRTTNAMNSTQEINIQLIDLSHFTALRPNPNFEQYEAFNRATNT